MEQIKYEKCMPWLMAAGRYIKREAARAEYPDAPCAAAGLYAGCERRACVAVHRLRKLPQICRRLKRKEAGLDGLNRRGNAMPLNMRMAALYIMKNMPKGFDSQAG